MRKLFISWTFPGHLVGLERTDGAALSIGPKLWRPWVEDGVVIYPSVHLHKSLPHQRLGVRGREGSHYSAYCQIGS